MLRSLLHLTTFLVTLIKLYLTLETDQDIINEKYNVKYANLTPYEKQFLDKIVNYDTEENLRYLILNKTQDLYLEHNDELYKQAEENIIFHDDHLKIKYLHYFLRHQHFALLYYPIVERFFFKLLRYMPSEVKRTSRFVYYKELGHDREEFLDNENIIDKRIHIIRNRIEDAIKQHYVLADDINVFNFVNNSRPKLDAFFRSENYTRILAEHNITLDFTPQPPGTNSSDHRLILNTNKVTVTCLEQC
uniref:Uncharacterized protein n=1 Tax=Cacopsylla melanoneura TaxID=428564 RepID=A0A8D9DWP4_9HEMI